MDPTTRERLRNKLLNNRVAEYKRIIESEPEWDSDTESESESEWEYESDSSEEYDEKEEKLIEKYGKPAVRKYKITKQYNVETVTVELIVEMHRMKDKHLNIKEFGIMSGIYNEEKKKEMMREVVRKNLIRERERRGFSSNLKEKGDVFTAICDMETMNKIIPCIQSVNMLRVIGCIDFLGELPWKKLSNNIEGKLKEYIDNNKRDLLLITDIKGKRPIEVASEILFKSFGIKIKTSKDIPYLKSKWIYDKVNDRILPITSDGKDNRLIPTKR